jgi:hypothetical protein
MRRSVGTRKSLWAALAVLAVVIVGAGIFGAAIFSAMQESKALEKAASTLAKKKPSPAVTKNDTSFLDPKAGKAPNPDAKPVNTLAVAAAQQKAALIEELKQELKAALKDRPAPIQEPIGKPGRVTTKEYERAKKLADSWLRRFEIEGGGSTPNPVSAFQFKLLGGDTRLLAEALIPRTMKMWIREGMKQEFDRWPLPTIERKVTFLRHIARSWILSIARL